MHDGDNVGAMDQNALFERDFNLFSVRVAELLDEIQKHQAMLHDECPYVYWKWRSVMDMIANEPLPPLS